MIKAKELRRAFSDPLLDAAIASVDDRDSCVDCLEIMIREATGRPSAGAADRAHDILLAWLDREERMAAMTDGAQHEIARLHSSDWNESAEGMAALDASGRWLSPLTIGSIARALYDERRFASAKLLKGGVVVAQAVAAALREEDNGGAFRDAWRALGTGERDIIHVLSAQVDRSETGFAENGKHMGHDRQRVKAEALVAGRLLIGQAMLRDANLENDVLTVFQLAATYFGTRRVVRSLGEAGYRDTQSDVLRDGAKLFEPPSRIRLRIREEGAADAREGGQAQPVRLVACRVSDAGDTSDGRDKAERLVADAKGVNDGLSGVWRSGGMERLLGAAAIGAVSGFSAGWREPRPMPIGRPHGIELAEAYFDREAHDHDEDVTLIVDGAVPHLMAKTDLDRLLILSVSSTSARLLELGYDALSEIVAERVHAWRNDRVSFARFLSHPGFKTPIGNLNQGLRVYDAAPTGRYVARLAREGKQGRAVVCQALADGEGRLVGYAAFDALSGEFRGEGRYAVYALNGGRAGHLAFDEGGKRVMLGDPCGGFVTAPGSFESGF
jgi:hypothetical protein